MKKFLGLRKAHLCKSFERVSDDGWWIKDIGSLVYGVQGFNKG
jgi:hypothetical protein